MRDRAVLDTGVIVALYFEEDGSEQAMEIVAGCSPITLDLAVAEVGNVAWKRVVMFGEDRDASRQSLCACLDFIRSCTLISSADLASLAYDIALECKTTFYDSLFLAASEGEQVPLLTLDQKMYERAKAEKNVRLIWPILTG
ncbi:MAG: type II toxin-antitoxin system VapC family toxin [Methanotrichaceae archaeon]|nr:type II toxin-antitoxin system VapC family toxin [Methanotrichaceae archaeon]